MTRVRARYGPDGYSVVSVGHAGTETACTAVSAIIGALAGWVHNHTGGVVVSLEKGEALIAFPDTIPGAEAVMDMTVIGLLQIAKAEPDSVIVEVVGQEMMIPCPDKMEKLSDEDFGRLMRKLLRYTLASVPGDPSKPRRPSRRAENAAQIILTGDEKPRA